MKDSRVESVIGRRYGKALFDSAKQHGRTEQIGDELEQLSELFAMSPGLRRYLLAPRVPIEVKVGFLERYLGDKVDVLSLQFLGLLLRKKRVRELEAVAAAYHVLLKVEQGIVEATVVTARETGADLLEDLQGRLAHMTGKTVELIHEIDPALLGGMTVYLGGKVVDGSVRTRLARVREALMATRVH